MLARSSAMRIEMPAEPPVSSSTTPLLLAASIRRSAATAVAAPINHARLIIHAGLPAQTIARTVQCLRRRARCESSACGHVDADPCHGNLGMLSSHAPTSLTRHLSRRRGNRASGRSTTCARSPGKSRRNSPHLLPTRALPQTYYFDQRTMERAGASDRRGVRIRRDGPGGLKGLCGGGSVARSVAVM